MKDNIAPNLFDVRFFGSAAVVPRAHRGADAVEELRGRPRCLGRNASNPRAICVVDRETLPHIDLVIAGFTCRHPDQLGLARPWNFRSLFLAA